MSNQQNVPITFKIIGVVAILWNLAGVVNFLFQATVSPEAIAEMEEADRLMIEATPSWLFIIFGIAVFAGLAGSIGLLMQKKWCIPVLMLSLVAVIIQMGYSTFATEAMEIMGAMAAVMAVLVTGISLFLWYYAKKADSNGWLS